LSAVALDLLPVARSKSEAAVPDYVVGNAISITFE
jgi:hypothetical protein